MRAMPDNRISTRFLKSLTGLPPVIVLALALVTGIAHAQQPPAGWQTGTEPATAAPVAPTPGMTVVPRSGGEPKTAVATPVRLVARLTDDGQHIDQGIVWRVFQDKGDAKPVLINTAREPSPVLPLTPGEYVVNAAYGRANLTRRITVRPSPNATEFFVLNAGGLVLKALIGSAEAPPNSVSYSILSDDRNQFGGRAVVMSGARPGLIIRLNAGIYQLVSTYGDANAVVRADVTVEAGKLTEATVAHAAARVTFKLVNREGGEAIADTQWSIQTLQGEVVKESAGALPMHTLAPGNYAAIAKSQGRNFRRDFSVQNGDAVQVEVLAQ